MSIVVMVLVVLGFLLPLPQYIEGPGAAFDLSKVVTIKNHPDKHRGEFLLTSVGIAKARPFTYLYAKLNPHYSIEPDDAVTAGQNAAEYDKVQNFYMKSSISEAIYTAYKAADKQVERKYRGIYILNISKKSNFQGVLKVGDVISRVNNRSFKTSAGFVNYVRHQKIGDRAKVTFIRNGKQYQVIRRLAEISKNRPGIGITLTDDVIVKSQIPIKVDPGEVGGPSGGLMFSLQIYSQLTNQNLRHNQKIAGTGTISGNGYVGEIGGIDKKVITAKRAGAKIFLAPYIKPNKEILKLEPGHKTNYEVAKQTAKKYAPDMKVIPITTFSQAVSYLKNN
nr:SepM family pheromone-processing serine protease [Lentilactobacillus kosonis]